MEAHQNIFEFTNYRSYLQAYYDDAKKNNPSWSYEAWSRKLGLQNNSSIIKILQGHREAGPNITYKLVDYFGFKSDERAYFEDLIRLSKAKKDPRLAVALMKKMEKQQPKSNVKFLDDKEFSAISYWWFYAIRQMTRLKDFRNDSHWIAKKLSFRVQPKEIKKAIQILLDLGLLKLDKKSNRLHISKDRINTSDDIASEALKRFHEGMLENAKSAIRSVKVKERQISGCTLAIAQEDIPEARKFIQQFEEEFIKLFDCKNADTIYQLNTQFFPLIKQNKGGK